MKKGMMQFASIKQTCVQTGFQINCYGFFFSFIVNEFSLPLWNICILNSYIFYHCQIMVSRSTVYVWCMFKCGTKIYCTIITFIRAIAIPIFSDACIAVRHWPTRDQVPPSRSPSLTPPDPADTFETATAPALQVLQQHLPVHFTVL